TALQKSLADGFKPTLAVVFISIKQDRKSVCEILHNEGIDIFGATSGGEFSNENQTEGEAVIMLLELSRNHYFISFEDASGKDLADVSKQLARTALSRFKNPAFILCSTSLTEGGEFLNGEKLVESIANEVSPDVNIYGGMAGDDGAFTGTYVFNHEKSTDSGIIALVLDEDKVTLHGMALSGWKPLGISRTVTRSNGRLIYTIDNQPAVNMYLKYLGNENFSENDKFKIFENIGSHYPFQIELNSGESVMVTPMGIDKDENALICEKEVQEGSVFHFSVPPDFDIVETILKNAEDLKNERQGDADALLIFSCIGRHTALGPMAKEENEGLAKIWDAPMAGFYTYGEFGRSPKGKRRIHSTTCSWVALKEK
ncbi:MAG: hypothetical protein EHM47_14970, partial [Ignavibacteriales bacterium]